MKSIFREYLFWSLAMFSVLIGFWFVYKPLVFFATFAFIYVPVDRARVAMLKQCMKIPEPQKAIKLVGIFLISPFIVSTFIGMMVGVPDGKERGEILGLYWVFYLVPAITTFLIQFLSVGTWQRGLERYGASKA